MLVPDVFVSRRFPLADFAVALSMFRQRQVRAGREIALRRVCGEGGILVESAWGAVSGLLPVRFPRPLTEPAVPISRQRALYGVCR